MERVKQIRVRSICMARRTDRSLTPSERAELENQLKERSANELARSLDVHPNTLKRALEGGTVRETVATRLARITPRVRTADEFQGAVAAPAPRQPTRQQGGGSWTLESVVAARADQIRGNFARPVRLVEAMSNSDAIFVPFHNRVAPQNAIATEFKPAGARGRSLARKANTSLVIPRAVVASIHATLVQHGVAVGIVHQQPNEAGTWIDCRLEEWPLEFVRWDEQRRTLETKVRDAPPVEIHHGDGRWIVFKLVDSNPWSMAACLLPAALVWAAHTGLRSDLMSSSKAHGLARIIGELPAGVALKNIDGELTPEASEYLDVLAGLGSGELPAAIVPAGSKTQFVTNQSTAWQIFTEGGVAAEKSAARIYLGTDAHLGSVGGAPGVDISTLFGLATTYLQGDLFAIEEGLYTGLIAPWAAINTGDSRYAPRLKYQIPDPDAERKREERTKAYDRFCATLAKLREQKLDVTQAVVDRVARDVGLEESISLAAASAKTSAIVLTPSGTEAVVRGSEARDALGLPPFGDARDAQTVAALNQPPAAPAPTPVVPV